ncbi:MAG: VCBS repeat-containing protein, partial [Candidatus Brocadiia bacterium]
IGVTNMGYMLLDGLGFAIPSEYVKEFLDNVDAFAFDPDNPNSGVKYMEVPVTSTDDSLNFTKADFIKAGHGLSCLTLADVNRDGVEEVVFVNNNEGEIGVLRLRTEEEKAELERPEDFEDLNRLPESERFKLDTHAVNNKISAIAVEDMNGDELPDILFHGDVDGLAVLEQEEDGTFDAPRKIAEVELAKRPDALQVADLDGDGARDILALGSEELNIFHGGTERSAFPLNVAWRDKLVDFYLRDINGDGRTDLAAFGSLRFHATRLLVQNDEGEFAREALLPSHVSGPVAELRDGAGTLRFVTLDKGKNRVRRMALRRRERAPAAGVLGVQAHALPLDAEPGTGGDLEVTDLDGDGYQDALTVNKAGSEFVLLRGGADGFTTHRSPAPQNVAGLKLWSGPEGGAALFSFSQEDRIFGVSRVEDSSVSFPRPINTEGQVEFLWLGELDGQEELLWVEKVDRDYVVRGMPVDDLASEAFSGDSGSIDVQPRTLAFGEDEEELEAALSGKPARLAFADFNGDETADLVIFWSYSGRESLYLGRGDGRYVSTIVDEEFLKEQDAKPLLVADITGDGAAEVLLVQPGFVRVLRVDDKQKLYAERQFNWRFHRVSRLVPYGEGQPPRFLALAEEVAKVVEFDVEHSRIRLLATVDLAGLDSGELKVADLEDDGKPDILMMGRNTVQVLRQDDMRWEAQSSVVMDAPLEYFNYWNLETADLDGDGRDELMLFDSRKAMFEVHRLRPDGTLKMILRHRLFERSIHQRRETDAVEMPKELVVGDVDNNGTPDLVLILQDRVAVYAQAPRKEAEE